jgi:hypothetical protein
MKIQTQEKVQATDLLIEQNRHLQNLALSAKRIDEFNRLVFKTQSGMDVPEGEASEMQMKEFKEAQEGRREAYEDMYHGDISVTNFEEV